MSLSSQAKLARFMERHQLLFAGMILLTGVAAAIRALEYYYHRSDYTWMFFLINGVGILQILSLVLILLNIMLMNNLPGGMRSCRKSVLLGSFTERTGFLAMSSSWIFTFLMLAAISEWTEPNVIFFGDHDTASLFPPSYYFQLLLSCMMLSYSLLFFFFYWRADAGDER